MKLGSSIRRRRDSRGGPRWSLSSGPVRVAAIVAGTLLAGFGFGWLFATQLLFPAPPPPGDLYEVPDVRGVLVEDARARLDEAGLALGEVHELHHPLADSGAVVGQAPIPGQLARPGHPVRVTLSRGPERRPVPEVARVGADWARNVLEAAGFEVTVDSVEADEPAGSILEVSPPVGTVLAVPGEVTLRVSLGPPGFPMPSLLGMAEREARDTVEALGLHLSEVEEVFRFGRDRGIVVEQSPPADTVVEVGSTVRFSVGRGRAPERDEATAATAHGVGTNGSGAP